MKNHIIVAVTAILALSACSDGPRKRLDGSTGQTIERTQPKQVIVNKLIDREGVSNFLERWGTVYPSSRNRMTVCSGHGCVFKQRWQADEKLLKEIQAWLPGANASDERDNLVKALELMLLSLKTESGLSKDEPGESMWNNGDKGQTSSSDEMINIVGLLAILAENGLLSYNKVIPGQSISHRFSTVYPTIEDASTKQVWFIVPSSKDGKLHIIRKKDS